MKTIEKIIKNIVMLENQGYVSKRDSRYMKIQELKEELKVLEKKGGFKHGCGCVTEDYKGGVKFIKMCKKHKFKGYVWVGLQHPK